MDAAATSFYVTGGTLQQGAPSYVVRQADTDLYEALSRGDYCYVLTARQMGKSSLMLYTAARLRRDGVTVILLDLQAAGQNLSVEQWYDGLLRLVGWQLDCEVELEEFWLAHGRLGPLQRWMAALREVVLVRCPGKVTLFIDEIDVVRALPFSTDELFAGIRECYNRRTQDPEYQRLTFCLLGVAAPADLISDTRTSPFNIGRRIELTDFTEAEAAPLALGLAGEGTKASPPYSAAVGSAAKARQGPLLEAQKTAEGRREETEQAESLLQRVLYWTGGHPYLTQRLCRAIVDARTVPTASLLSPSPSASSAPLAKRAVKSSHSPIVDNLCNELFLSHRARERDDNLLFVEDRLLRGEADIASVLGLYTRVRGPRETVPDDETNPLVSALHLSGIVREQNGCLKVRNRIYARVFDRAWVEANLPDAELRRLQTVAREEARKRRQAEARERAIRHLLYVAHMTVAQQALSTGNAQQALALLEGHRPRAGEDDLRGFEWRYLWRLCHHDESLVTLRGHTDAVYATVFSPDGELLASGGADRTVILWQMPACGKLTTLEGQSQRVDCLAFSPDGRMLAVGCGRWDERPGEIRVWDTVARQVVALLTSHAGGVPSVAFSPTGHLMATASADRTIKLWDTGSWREVATLLGSRGTVVTVAFSPDGTILATSGRDQIVRLWDLVERREIASFPALGGTVRVVAFSPDGKLLATGNWQPVVRVWDVGSRRELAVLAEHRDAINGIAFSPDGSSFATVSSDCTIRLWELATGRAKHTLTGHTTHVNSVAFSPDGRTLVTGSHDRSVKLWSATARRGDVLRGHVGIVSSVAFSPDGRSLVSGSFDRTVRLWDIVSCREIRCLRSSKPIAAVAFAPDGKSVAAGTGIYYESGISGEVIVWDVTSGAKIATFAGHEDEVSAVAYAPDSRMLATGSKDGSIALWDLTAKRTIATLDGLGRVTSVQFSPDGRTLVTVSEGTGVKLWDVAARREIPPPADFPDAVDGAAFSPDGKTLALCKLGRPTTLWSMASRRKVATLDTPQGGVALAFSPDGRTLAWIDGRRTITLANLATRQVAATLEAPELMAWCVAFSPDGNLLATADHDGAVRLWRAASFAETDAAGDGRRPSR